MPEEGAVAPDFELPADDGTRVRLSELRGSPVVLFFYPRADTPGCTTQACELRDRRDDFTANGAIVLGVSPDSLPDVRRFHRKLGLNFRLLADEDHQVAESYGVWVEKSMFGRNYWGVERTTFLIGGDGRIRKILRKVKPESHAEEVLAAL
jgi:thioredoxin-dependent peroxiredoxin